MHKPQPFPAGISGDPAPATRQAATGINQQAGGRTDIFSGPLQAQLSPLAVPLLLLCPEPPGDGDEPDGWSALCEEVAEDREAYEQGLRLTWEHEDDFDPLTARSPQRGTRCWRRRRGCGC